MGQSFARCTALWVLFPMLYKKEKKRKNERFFLTPLPHTAQMLFFSNPVSCGKTWPTVLLWEGTAWSRSHQRRIHQEVASRKSLGIRNPAHADK